MVYIVFVVSAFAINGDPDSWLTDGMPVMCCTTMCLPAWPGTCTLHCSHTSVIPLELDIAVPLLKEMSSLIWIMHDQGADDTSSHLCITTLTMLQDCIYCKAATHNLEWYEPLYIPSVPMAWAGWADRPSEICGMGLLHYLLCGHLYISGSCRAFKVTHTESMAPLR